MEGGKRSVLRRTLFSDSIVSFLAITVASAAWITGALIVAFPKYAFSLDIVDLLRDFLTQEHHALTLLILLFADIFIAIMVLNDVHVRNSLVEGRRIGLFFLCLLLYLIFALLGPSFLKPTLDSNPIWLGLLALCAFGVPRGMAYAPPQKAIAVGRKPRVKGL
ncbi:MAG: hypothetical protein EOP60_05445 [Sphingomonadales bacterium]|nr:MAG: hypothetical protein EOP60_05445 [Sphingomonadales bacterium]